MERTCLSCGAPLVKKPGPGRWPIYCPGCRPRSVSKQRPPKPRLTSEERSVAARHAAQARWAIPGERKHFNAPCEKCGGVKDSRARRFCRACHLAANANPPVEHSCAHCGGTFEAPPSARRKYCSLACKVAVGQAPETRAKLSAAAKSRSYVRTCECGAVVETSTPNLKRCAECRAEHERARSSEKNRRQRARGYVSPSHARRAKRRRHRRAQLQLERAARGFAPRGIWKVDSGGVTSRSMKPEHRAAMAAAVKRTWADPELRERMSQLQRSRNPRRGPDERGFTKHQRRLIYARDGNVCQLCGGPVDPEQLWPQDGWLAPTADHIVARANGGKREVANGQTAHMICNWLKLDKDDHEPPPWEAIQRQALDRNDRLAA